MLTKRQIEILQLMAAAEAREDFSGAELVCEGLVAYLGHMQVSRRTIKALVDHAAIRLESGEYSGGYQVWCLNSTGELIARKPEMADPIWLALHRGKSFTLEDDKIVYLKR